MVEKHSLACLQHQWMDFLQARGHHVEVVKEATAVVVSRNGSGEHYRWILFTAAGVIKSLRREETARLRMEVCRAEEAGQKPFVVIRFAVPQTKLVIKPAEVVTRTNKVGSARGGIGWCE
jgi:hypothetical protein